MFNALIAAAALLTINPEPAPEDGVLQLCTNIGNLSETIMDSRQRGGSMSDMIRLASTNGRLRELTVIIIEQAFEVPRFNTPENRRRAVVDFRNEKEAECFRALRDE